MTFGNLVKKAFYLGIGVASYAGEKAGSTFSDLQEQVQKLADEMVSRGELTTEEARRMVDELLQRAKQPPATPPDFGGKAQEPRQIEILDMEDPSPSPVLDEAGHLRSQVSALEAELSRLKRESKS